MHALLDLPDDLAPLQELIAGALDRVVDRFDRQLVCELSPVRSLCEHVERYRGKMLRPTLVLLCGLATADESDQMKLSDDHITLAAVSEMVHMATLVHDDVLDEADTRRRGETVNRLRGNEAAVILGDYLIAGAFHLCSQVASQEPSLVIGRASMDMAAGELLQLHNREDFSIDEPTYFEIVRRKTGALIAAACRLGAIASGASRVECETCEAFGYALGVAFQIQDDLLDLTGHQGVVGKNVGKDAEKGKLTLPVIHHLAECDPQRRAESIAILSRMAERRTASDAG
ncbi:MAG: polyprenyl synthetase family protein, partial [Planctomycetota bacterium]